MSHLFHKVSHQPPDPHPLSFRMHHGALCEWGLDQLIAPAPHRIADLGKGNTERILKKFPDACPVTEDLWGAGKQKKGQPAFDLVTALDVPGFFENMEQIFPAVAEVLEKGGRFAIVIAMDKEKELSEDRIFDLLKKAGFSTVSLFRKEKRHWLCFIALKD